MTRGMGRKGNTDRAPDAGSNQRHPRPPAAIAVVRVSGPAAGEALESLSLFDVYRGASIGDGRKSVAIEVTLQPRGSAMKDDEIEAISQAIVKAVAKATGGSAEGVRDFLDSRHGRHFADDVANGIHSGSDLKAAIDAAITRWMGWTISRATSRDHGIPVGLPYLTGFVGLYEILADAE